MKLLPSGPLARGCLLLALLVAACGGTTASPDGAAGVEVGAEVPGDVGDELPPPSKDTDAGPEADAARAEPDAASDAPALSDAALAESEPDGPADDAPEPPDAPPDVPDLSDAAFAESEPVDIALPPPVEVEAFVSRCEADPDCDDGLPCTVDTCAGGVCAHEPADEQIPCDDGDPCTTGDLCVAGACAAGAPISCDDGNPCTLDQCGVGQGCSHWALDGKACDDGDPCTGGDACQGGACQPGALDACPVCGDGACGDAPYETCESCPGDCGACVEDCATPGDEDLDGLADCQDPDCAALPACLPPACASALPLACGASWSGAPYSNHLSGYVGCTGYETGYGDDDLYAVTLPPGTSSLSVTLYIDYQGGLIREGDDLDLFILRNACDGAACVASATSSSYNEYVATSGAPGDTFYVAVELYSIGFFGYGDYSIYVDCY